MSFRREPISKFDFPNLALVEHELPPEAEEEPPAIITGESTYVKDVTKSMAHLRKFGGRMEQYVHWRASFILNVHFDFFFSEIWIFLAVAI